MSYCQRLMLSKIKSSLERGKSVLLLGARQTGKTTLVQKELQPDLSYNLMDIATLQRFEADPSVFKQELSAALLLNFQYKRPVVFVDEVQKLPQLLDAIQVLIDEKKAQFILSGSSARKLRHGASVNFLPGRVVLHRLDPLALPELGASIDLQMLLEDGSLPEVVNTGSREARQIDLQSYVQTYLEEEVRKEAVVRQVGQFARFLEFAASQSGHPLNISALAQQVGLTRYTVSEFMQILEDCLIAHRIEPYLQTKTNRRLNKSAKYVFFDLGVRRLAAKEVAPLPSSLLSHVFEQWVGLELIKYVDLTFTDCRLYFWRDHAGPEVDYILQVKNQLIPIEVKWTELPKEKDSRHVRVFMQEYGAERGYVVCRCAKPMVLADNIIALPWQQLWAALLDKLQS